MSKKHWLLEAPTGFRRKFLLSNLLVVQFRFQAFSARFEPMGSCGLNETLLFLQTVNCLLIKIPK